MKRQRIIQIESWGEFPFTVKSIIESYNGKEASEYLLRCLDEDITLSVLTMGESHGNINKTDKSAWLAPRNGDNSFNVSIKW